MLNNSTFSVHKFIHKLETPLTLVNSYRGVYRFYNQDAQYSEFWARYQTLSNCYYVKLFLTNPIFYRLTYVLSTTSQNPAKLTRHNLSNLRFSVNRLNNGLVYVYENISRLNIIPNRHFKLVLNKKFSNLIISTQFKSPITHSYYHGLVRFIEYVTGKKSLIQVYSFMNQEIRLDFAVRYEAWAFRLNYFERKLGHRFFLKETLYIIHLALYMKDVVIFSS